MWRRSLTATQVPPRRGRVFFACRERRKRFRGLDQRARRPKHSLLRLLFIVGVRVSCLGLALPAFCVGRLRMVGL